MVSQQITMPCRLEDNSSGFSRNLFGTQNDHFNMGAKVSEN